MVNDDSSRRSAFPEFPSLIENFLSYRANSTRSVGGVASRSQTWRRRAVRLRDFSGRPQDEPMKLRSVMTLENISFYHLLTRHGYPKMSYDLNEKEVIYVTTSFLKKGDHFSFQITGKHGKNIESFRVGFLPAYDYPVEHSRQAQMDEFCLNPVPSKSILQLG